MNPKLPYPPAFRSADALDLHNPYKGLVRVRSYCSAPVQQWERLRRSPKLRARGLRTKESRSRADDPKGPYLLPIQSVELLDDSRFELYGFCDVSEETCSKEWAVFLFKRTRTGLPRLHPRSG
ncbi:UNVERIFIED_CONTAM: hypothetical protein K2H54_047979 [Gekko kuhli]